MGSYRRRSPNWKAFAPPPLHPQILLGQFFKKGRDDRLHTMGGLASAIRTDVKLEEEIYTVVEIFFPLECYPHDFCKHGDSGAILT